MTDTKNNVYNKFRELYVTRKYKAVLSADQDSFSLHLYKCFKLPLIGRIKYGKPVCVIPLRLLQLAFADSLYAASKMKPNTFGNENRLHFSEYKAYVMKGFMENATGTPMDLMHACLGMSGELGEVQEAIKKHVFHGKDLDRVKLIEEIGDFTWYFTSFLALMGIDFADVLLANKVKLDHRYKNGRRDLMFRDPDAEHKLMSDKLKNGTEGIKYAEDHKPAMTERSIVDKDYKKDSSQEGYSDSPGHQGVMV